jgi:hypothetical protein
MSAGIERCKAAGGCAPALGCGSPSLREGFPAVLGLIARRETRFTHCVRCVRTIATSQKLKRAVRATMSPVLLGAAYVAADAHPPTALLASPRHARRTPRTFPRGGRYPAGAISGAASSAGLRAARVSARFVHLTRRDSSSGTTGGSEASFSARPQTEQHSGVGAQRRPPQHERRPGTAHRAAPCPRIGEMP